ncbi:MULTISPECIES: amidohydrolase [unclassified Halomonas]|uniref:amidohydrolase n=1 Tax=unclassified Halomonas TaxID=2609666 RepID=UPI0006DABC94|nr:MULTISPECIES: amidohydrolase [unclassified Halomonas]KPQ27795.1 MAG: carbon-nitrogen hydrolase family protein [Halomonas sp. HL-93]SBR48664.1 carbon-nitrogen hydrolase family protein [Halomonas sp. HL-93]SNY96169.1 Carbon-nitrogen hydrolase [Halomonas sp. hl-4]
MSQLRTSLVQCDLRWENPHANHTHLETLLGDLDGRDTDLIVLPEMFATGFTMNSREMAQPMEDSQSVAWLLDQARSRNCVMTGSVAIQQGGEFYNRLIWATPQGALTYYDKRHLFRMAGEHERYDMGERRKIVELNGFKILLTVCYDLRFPVWLRQQPTQGEHFEYDALLCVANWPAPRRQPWRTLLQARAIENLTYVIGVNRVGEDAKGMAYSGDSMLVDFKGEPLIDHSAHTPFLETGCLNKTDLDAFREKFPAWQDADRFSLLSGVGH